MSQAPSLSDRLYRQLFDDELPDLTSFEVPATPTMGRQALFGLVQTQLTSRLLDLHSRELQAAGESFYTIGSAGHEANAAVAAALRSDDMAFLHYRSGAFFISRQQQREGATPIYDMLLSFAASKADPIASGRHKVLGSKDVFVPPQTSTIASHLPKAVGMAHSMSVARQLKHAGTVPDDSVVLCSFGDASANHSTAQGAINTACWAAYQGAPMPLVLLCEDNGIGISTGTPENWIAASFSQRPGLHYLRCDGRDLNAVFATAREAERLARTYRQPVFLHMDCVRLYGHAGSDAEMTYLPKQQIANNEANDPLRYSLALLAHYGIATQSEMAAHYQTMLSRIRQVGQQAVQQPKLTTAAEVMADLAPEHPTRSLPKPLTGDARQALFRHEKHNQGKPQTLAKLLNWALHDLLAQYPNTVMMGEDIGKKGGVYGVTNHLCQAFGPGRVMNTVLDEQSILGMAIGYGHNGFLPIPEIQFLAYVHNAEDQIRGEAATLQFFSSAQYSNPMVVRIAGLAYQKGFGGHFHNDNSLAVFRDIPGVVVACPSNGASGARLLRECVRLAEEQRRVVVFIEPIALYNARDLLAPGDDGWVHDYPAPTETQPFGEVSVHGKGTDIAIVSYGNGYYLSRQAAAELEQQGHKVRVIDLNWLHPLPMDSLMESLNRCKRVLLVDECRETGSLSEELYTRILERRSDRLISRVTGADSFIPLAKAAYLVLPGKEDIVQAARHLLQRGNA